MAEAMHHVSSAILRVSPDAGPAVQTRIIAAGAEIVGSDKGRLVVLIEGRNSGEVGEILTRLSLLQGVHSACMVYEHAEPLHSMGDTGCQ